MSGAGGLPVLLLYLLVDLLPMNGNLTRGVDRNAHLPPLNVQNADRDIVADPYAFSDAARQNEHVLGQEVEKARLNDPRGHGQGCLEQLFTRHELRRGGDLVIDRGPLQAGVLLLER